MDENEVRELLKQITTPISKGKDKECYHVGDFVILKESRFKSKEDIGFRKDNVAIHNQLAEKGVLTPKTFYFGCIDDNIYTVQEFIEGDPLFLYPRQTNEGFKPSNHMSALFASDADKHKNPSELLKPLLLQHNLMNLEKLANAEQELFDKFLQDVTTVHGAGIGLEEYGENFLFNDKGIFMVDLINVVTDNAFDTARRILIDGASSNMVFHHNDADAKEHLLGLVKQITKKLKISQEKLTLQAIPDKE